MKEFAVITIAVGIIFAAFGWPFVSYWIGEWIWSRAPEPDPEPIGDWPHDPRSQA